MADFWESLKATGESIGGALLAPPGVVLDLATTPFDDKDDDFGSVVAKVANRGGDVLDPLLNPETLSGLAVHKTLDAANWALWNVANEPVSTVFLAFQHATEQDNVGDRFGSLFDGETWKRAYSVAQETSVGEAVAYGLLDADWHGSPLQFEDPFEEVTAKTHSTIGPKIKWGVNIAATWYADPLVVVGKAASMGRASWQYQKLAPQQQAEFLSLVDEGAKASRVKSRTDKYLDWIGGNNSMRRPLEGPEILHGSPELRRYVREPHVIAGLLADANKTLEGAARRDAQRRILAVAAGDTSQVGRLKAEAEESAHIADALVNMSREGSLNLKLLADAPTLKHDPVFVRRLEEQLEHLDSTGKVQKFLDDFNAHLDHMLGTEGSMGRSMAVHSQGRRAVNRLNDTGLGRSLANAHKKVDEKVDAWAARRAQETGSSSALFQHGRYTVPLVAVRTVGFLASPYTKAPVAISDALRRVHFTGVANLHDWGGSTSQLDSMMAVSNVPVGERMKALSEAYIAKTEPEKMRVIEKIEKLSMRSMARDFASKSGRDIDADYIETLMTAHAAKRQVQLGQLRGRAYAATEMSDEMMAARGLSMQHADDAARWSESKGVSSKPQGKWRVDQVNDDGTPLALPMLETQLANTVPLLDMGIAKTLLERDTGYLARVSRAWKDEARELGRLSDLKAKGHKGLDKAIQRKAESLDWLVNAGQVSMRAWKFSVLFRLGYPIRVVMDDHWRIWSQMGAATFYGQNLREWGSNLKHNQWDRKAIARQEMQAKRVRRQEILDELDSDLIANHEARRADLRRLRSSVGGLRASATKLSRRIEEAETKRSLGLDAEDVASLQQKLSDIERKLADKQAHEQYLLDELGDYGPEDLRRELKALEEEIDLGTKALRGDKRRIGEKDIKLDDGTVLPGGFAGEHGPAMRQAASSNDTFDVQMRGVEDRIFQAGMRGHHRTITASEAGHLEAWADVLNYQFRQSPVAMFFIKGGTRDEFVRWIKEPEQAQLRQRLAHYAHDPEDWAGRVQALVFDYIPNEQLLNAVKSGRVSARDLGKMFPSENLRPAVHGRSVADNLGTSGRALGMSKAINRIYRYLGEVPTDTLSRHPFFNSLYKQHAQRAYDVKKIGYAKEGRQFTQADLDDIAKHARKSALADVKRTLFDISAHSHAAHVMRFVSPFFAAHQESIARWWRIVGDDPSVVRRFTLAFDAPRHAGLVIDENGDPVKPGEAISSEHSILVPKWLGFGDGDWKVSENSFNLVLQGGITNPGGGPLVSVPMEWMAREFSDQPEIERMARIFNPYPPQSPMASALPATLKRASALLYGATGVDLLAGVGEREFADAWSGKIQDLTVDFKLEHGREPTATEAKDIRLKAKRSALAQSFHRLLWNSLSPAPARPMSKYAMVQHGWYKIQEQARAEGHDFDWAWARFEDKYGSAYLPLIESAANNPAWLDASSATSAALKQYRPVLDRLNDPSLTRMVIGAYADDLIAENKTLGEYSPTVRADLRRQQMAPDNPETYYSYDDPAQAMFEQMARRGWQQYGQLTAALTAQAQQLGLESYRDSDQLMAIREVALDRLKADNHAFADEWDNFDGNAYEKLIEDMKMIAATPALANDPERTDIKTLDAYLRLRDYFMAIFAEREAQGLGTFEHSNNEKLRQVYTLLVNRLVESNTQFEEHMFNGTLERDPLLVGAE